MSQMSAGLMEQYGPLHELVDRHFDHHNRRPLKKIACAAKYLRGNVRALDVDLEQRRRPHVVFDKVALCDISSPRVFFSVWRVITPSESDTAA
jgi:hypothetical protein